MHLDECGDAPMAVREFERLGVALCLERLGVARGELVARHARQTGPVPVPTTSEDNPRVLAGTEQEGGRRVREGRLGRLGAGGCAGVCGDVHHAASEEAWLRVHGA